jgi:putative heme iron utilization protein
MTYAERRKVQELAEQAGVTSSEVLRALVRAAVEVKPAQPAEATIRDSGHVGAEHAATVQA